MIIVSAAAASLPPPSAVHVRKAGRLWKRSISWAVSETPPRWEEAPGDVMGADGEEDPADVLARLQDMQSGEDRAGAIGEGPDFVDWKSFAKALGAQPFERW